MKEHQLQRLNDVLDIAADFKEHAPEKALIISGNMGCGKTMLSWFLQRKYKKCYRTYMQHIAQASSERLNAIIANSDVVIIEECRSAKEIRDLDSLRIKYYSKLFVFIINEASYKYFPEKHFLIINLGLTDFAQFRKGATND